MQRVAAVGHLQPVGGSRLEGQVGRVMLADTGPPTPTTPAITPGSATKTNALAKMFVYLFLFSIIARILPGTHA